jgi:hypothetical protein
MDCNECERVHAEAAACWQAYLAEKHLNRTFSKNPSNRNLQKEDDLLRQYQLAAALQRVHLARAHPEQGFVARIEDLQLIAEADSKT